MTNVGSGYDKWSGHFRAPIKGLYVFSCTVMAVNKDNILVVLMKNGQRMAQAWSDSTPWETGAVTIVLTLKKGDQVWIKRSGYGRKIAGNYNWFSGYLISTRVWRYHLNHNELYSSLIMNKTYVHSSLIFFNSLHLKSDINSKINRVKRCIFEHLLYFYGQNSVIKNIRKWSLKSLTGPRNKNRSEFFLSSALD